MLPRPSFVAGPSLKCGSIVISIFFHITKDIQTVNEASAICKILLPSFSPLSKLSLKKIRTVARMFKEGKGEIVFEKEKRKRKIESFWPGRRERKKKQFRQKRWQFLSLHVIWLENPPWYNLYFGPRGGHSFPENERPFELPRQYRDKKRKRKKEKEEGPRFFCAFTKVSLSRLATLTLPGFYDSFHVWLGKKRIPGKCARPLNALCRPCRHAAFVLTRYYVRPLYPSSSSLSCSPRCIFFVLVTRKLIIFESTSRNLIVALLGMVSRRDFYPKNDK